MNYDSQTTNWNYTLKVTKPIPLLEDHRISIKEIKNETCIRCYRRCLRRYHADQDHDRTGANAVRGLTHQDYIIYTAQYQHGCHPHSREKEQEIPVQSIAVEITVRSLVQVGCLACSSRLPPIIISHSSLFIWMRERQVLADTVEKLEHAKACSQRRA